MSIKPFQRKRRIYFTCSILLLLLATTACEEQGRKVYNSSPEERPAVKKTMTVVLAQGLKIARSDLIAPRTTTLNSKPKVTEVHTNVNAGAIPDLGPVAPAPRLLQIGKGGLPIPTAVKTQGKIISVRYPANTPATLPEMKDLAISDIRCLDIDQGMKSGLVVGLLQDRLGYIWIGTDGGGMSRYDGNSFIHFTTEEGFPDNTVNAMVEDRAGRIWIGTAAGLTCYDGNRFTHFTTAEGLSHDYVWCLAEDRRGNLWIGTKGGLTKFETNPPSSHDGFDGFFTNYTTAEGLADPSIRTIAEDKDGNIWLGTNAQGVHRFTPRQEDRGGYLMHLSTRNGLSGDKVRSVLADSEGRVWIGTFNNGVNIYVPEQENSSAHFLQYSFGNGLSSRSVISFLEDRHRNIWIGTGAGFHKYESLADGTASFTFYSTDQGLSHTNVYALLEDNQGNLWVGTYNGLCIYDPLQEKSGGSHFRYYSKKEGLLSDKVISILEDRRGDMWFGTMGGLHRYDGQTMAQYDIEDGLSSRSVRAMMEDRNGDLWFGTERGGLNRFRPESHGKTGPILQYGIAQGLSDIHITAMLEDSRGDYWFGTLRDGVTRFKPDTVGKEGTFFHYDTSSGLSSNNLRFILEDKDGRIWMGTKGGGASCYMPGKAGSEGTFRHFTTREGLSHNNVNTILQDEQGYLWFGTWGGGITRFDPVTEQFNYYTTEHGLSSNIIWTILEDHHNRIWMATEKGLSLLVPRVELPATSSDYYRFYTFGKADGLKTIVFEGNSVFLDSRNQLWWGGGFNGGLTMLDLNHFQLPAYVPQPELNSLEINQRRIDFRHLDSNAPVERALLQNRKGRIDFVTSFQNYPIGLYLPHRLNHLTFQFSAVDWQAPHKIKYSYRMEGLEEEWSPPNTSTSADYRNLPYGNFTFQLRSIGAAQLWSIPFSYSFTIHPPWWQTWWAKMTYLVSGLLLIYAFVQWQLQQLRKERNDKKEFAEALIDVQEAEKKRIARDLHDGIGQSLLLIKKQLERTEITTKENQKLIENTLEEVRSISRDLHPFQLEKFGLTAAIQDGIRKVEQSTELFISQDIQNIDRMLSAKAEINLYRTIQESLSNIVKHADASAAKVSIHTTGKRIAIQVQDNGKGFEPGIAADSIKSMGLKTMFERISSIGGQLTFHSGASSGTTIRITIPFSD